MNQSITDNPPAKFVQIAVSVTEDRRDLYALDSDGRVWKYHDYSNGRGWVRLPGERRGS
jgi:hypothetical protein